MIDRIEPRPFRPYAPGMSLDDYARGFPHMGGVKIGPWLRDHARRVTPGRAVVELGSWLGGGTAFLAHGAPARQIHCYDRFVCAAPHVAKAAAFGVRLAAGDSTLGWVRAALAPFGADLRFHPGDLAGLDYDGPPVGLYVDDASKSAPLWSRAMKIFRPRFVPGETFLFLMDFFFYERAGPRYAVQRDYMARNAASFELVDHHVGGTSCALYRYCA